MRHDPKTCKWHLCGATFTPTRSDQDFCCTHHRKKRAVWKQMRGAPLVDLLIAGEFGKINEHRNQIQKEISNE